MSRYGFEQGVGMFKGSSFEILVSTGTSTSFSAVVYGTKPMRALFTVENSSARYRYDGTAPTVSTGHLIGSGDVVAIIGQSNIQQFKVIAVTSTAKFMVTYEGDIR